MGPSGIQRAFATARRQLAIALAILCLLLLIALLIIDLRSDHHSIYIGWRWSNSTRHHQVFIQSLRHELRFSWMTANHLANEGPYSHFAFESFNSHWDQTTLAASEFWRRNVLHFKGFAGVGYGQENIQPLVGGWTQLTQIIFLPDWLPETLFFLTALVLIAKRMRRQRRLRHGLCAMCGYDLRASNDRCPECGEPFSRVISQSTPTL